MFIQGSYLGLNFLFIPLEQYYVVQRLYSEQAGSAVSIVTRYWLDDPGFDPWQRHGGFLLF